MLAHSSIAFSGSYDSQQTIKKCQAIPIHVTKIFRIGFQTIITGIYHKLKYLYNELLCACNRKKNATRFY